MIRSVKKLAILLSRDQIRQDFTAFYLRLANFLIKAILKLWAWKAEDKFNRIKSIKIKYAMLQKRSDFEVKMRLVSLFFCQNLLTHTPDSFDS